MRANPPPTTTNDSPNSNAESVREVVNPSDAPLDVPTDCPPRIEVAAAANSLDISTTIDGWDCAPDELTARLIRGDDGKPRLQMRVELGVMQMEIEGRPDGLSVAGCYPTQLAGTRARLIRHRQRHRSEFGFSLSDDEVTILDQEGRLFARRYLAWFVLGEWQRVISDTRHHLAVLGLLRDHAKTNADAQRGIVRWLPYAAMMLARAEAASATSTGDLRRALKIVQSAQRRLKRHYRQHGGSTAYGVSSEVRALKAVARQVRKRIPVSPMRRLKRQLRIAVERERYEQAARLRDQIETLGANVSR